MSKLLLLLFSALFVLSQSIDIYVDPASSSPLGSGTPNDPLKTLDQALALMNSLKTQEKSIAIYLKKAENENSQYTAQDLVTIYKGVNGTVIESLTVSAWDAPVTLKSEEDCWNLPTINGSLLSWKFESLASVKFIGLNIIDFQGQILINSTKQVVLSNSCLKNSRSGLSISETNQLTIEDAILMVDTKMTKFVSFLNHEIKTKDLQISFKNISVIVTSSSHVTSPCFDLAIEKNRVLGELRLTLKDLKIKLREDNQTLPFLGKVKGFNIIDIEGFYVENQSFSMTQEDSTVFHFLNTSQIDIRKVSFINNSVNGSLSLFTAENSNVLNFKDVDISNNFFKTDGSLFRFANMQQMYAFDMRNSVIKSNRFEGKTNILNLNDSGRATFQMSNITIESNINTHDDFGFLTIDNILFYQFKLADFNFTDNNLTGSIFSIENLPEQKDLPKTFNFSNILISNCQSSGLTLLYLNAVPETDDLAPEVQWTTVSFANLSILNSTFKGKHSLDWQDQDTLFEVLNAMLYVKSSTVAGNTFDSVDFIVMKSQTSSVFLANSSFDNNNFTRAGVIITKFDQVSPLTCGLCDYKLKSVKLQYRFTHVMRSNFTNLRFNKAPLLTINTPYIFMHSNKFENVNSAEGELIMTRKFYPQTCGNKDPVFTRDWETERKVFSGLDAEYLQSFQGIMDNSRGFKKYLYMFSSNRFENLTLKDRGVILLNEYNFNEGSIILQGNRFNKITADGEETIDVIRTGGQILNFYMINNTADTIHDPRSILRFSDFVNNTFLLLLNNSVNNFKGESAFMVAGVNLNTTRILQNKVTNSEFTNSVFNIEVIQNKGIQTWYQNTIAGNYLNAVDKSLSDVPDSKRMIKPMSPVKISKTIKSLIILNVERHEGNFSFTSTIMKDNIVRKFDDSYYHKLSFLLVAIQESHRNSFFVMTDFEFLNNTYLNSPDYSFMKEMNALFSLLVGNSWCIISGSRFEGLKMVSKGNSLFYIAANKTTVVGNTFKHLTTYHGNSIFDLMTIGAIISQNIFEDIKLKGAGVFVMNQASPREGIDFKAYFDFNRNHFEQCKIIENQQGDIVTVDSRFLDFKAINNTILDSFNYDEGKSLFYLKDTSCSPCLFRNNSFITKDQDVPSSLFYQTSRCQGEISIVDTQIHHKNSFVHFDSLLMIQESPLIRASIIGLTYVKPEEKNAGVRLCQMDSGSLTVQDLEIKGMKYYGDQNLIQVLGDYRDSSASLNLSISNITVKNLDLKLCSADESGLISFEKRDQDGKKYALNFFMSKSKFMDITGVSIVSLKVPEMDSVSIENSTFERIQSAKGPAMNSLAKHSEDKPLKISGCKMNENTASKVGGAIYMNPTNYSIFENVFSKNKAERAGGAIYLAGLRMNETLLKNNSFVENSAESGQVIASSIKRIAVGFTFEEDMGQYLDTIGETMIIRNASSRGIEFTSLDIAFIDFNGQPTVDLNSSLPFLTMTFRGRTNRTFTSTSCVEEGCFIPGFDMILSGKADEIITVDVEYQSDILQPLVNNWKTSFAIELRGCVNGEHYNENTITCDYCPKGTYSMSPNFPCQNCPLNANCSGGNSVLPKTGFWKSESETIVAASLVECKQDGIVRCEGGSKGCANGFTGVKCQQCDFENGYVESGLLNCKKCKDFWHSLLLSGGGMLLYLIYKAVCIGKMYSTNEVFASSKKDTKGKTFERACEKGYYVKVLMVYSQILSLIFLFNGEVKGTMASLLQIGNPSEFILVNLQCSLRAIGVRPQDFIYVSTCILLISPVVQMILIILIAKIFVQRYFPSLKMSQFARLTIIYVILLEQPGIVGNLTAFLSCSHDNITGGDYITLHPNWSCNDPRYLFFKKFLAIPFLAFWAVAIPLFMFFSLYFRRKNLEQLEVRGTWGALYNLAKTSHYYWGTVVMILSLSISYISYTFQEDPQTSAFTVFVLLLTYQFSVKLVKPFRFAAFNFVETVAFNLLMLSVVLGYFGNDIHERSLKLVAYGILAVLNATMLVFLGVKVFDLVALEYIFKAKNKLKSWFGCLFGIAEGERKIESQEENEGEDANLDVSEDANYVELSETLNFNK